ncbi:Ubiquinone biosynthesis O-methyltransferase [bioreactor metagenome]|uniref:Ubiquinone biosynthesis O-methyltransferase n=1 Tax=bioreactor metagenome TaxID=1076179 RepID=A0A644ZNN0_9ZZZZ
MQERHKNRKLYFDEQDYTTSKYVIPFIENFCKITSETTLLEIGCGEGGNLKPFMDLGCRCVGIDLNEGQINNAKEYFSSHPNNGNLELILRDIYEIDREDFTFDVIMLRDVIEHIHDQKKFMGFVKRFLKSGGIIFFAFPPWYMPFGGHQQICSSKISKLPYLHLLPKGIYRWFLKSAGEQQKTIDDLLEIKETGISIERFQRILRKENYTILKRVLYFINPNYEIKFHLKPRRMLPVLRSIPFFRNYYITAGYYVVSIDNKNPNDKVTE